MLTHLKYFTTLTQQDTYCNKYRGCGPPESRLLPTDFPVVSRSRPSQTRPRHDHGPRVTDRPPSRRGRAARAWRQTAVASRRGLRNPGVSGSPDPPFSAPPSAGIPHTTRSHSSLRGQPRPHSGDPPGPGLV